MTKLKTFSSFILGSIFFLFVLLYMFVESWVIYVKKMVKFKHLYNFREVEFPLLDVLVSEQNELTPSTLGALPNTLGASRTVAIPEELTSGALEVLLDIQMEALSVEECFELEFELSSPEDPSKVEYIYLFHRPFDDQHHFNTVPLWYPIPNNRTIKLQLVDIVGMDKPAFGGELRLIGAR
ncbi:MAG: hypothetical protein AAFV95_03670 [Bacteroidota bacterium]